MSQTESLSRRYNHMHSKPSKNSKAPTIRLTASQLINSEMFSFDGPANKSNFVPFARLRDHSHSQNHHPTHKSQRKTQSVLSKKKNQSLVKNQNKSKNSTKNHSRLQSEATTTIRNQTVLPNDLNQMLQRMSTVLDKYKGREETWKKEKEQYELTIQYLLEKLKKESHKKK